MALPKPQTYRFQISMRAKVPRGSKLSNALATQIAREWIENGESPTDFDIRLVIWHGHSKREITEIDDSDRGLRLRAYLARSLQQRRLIIKEMGGSR